MIIQIQVFGSRTRILAYRYMVPGSNVDIQNQNLPPHKIRQRLTLIGAPPDGELDLTALCRAAHHADHDVVGGAHHRLPVHRHDLVPGVEPAVHVGRAARYYVSDGDLGNI